MFNIRNVSLIVFLFTSLCSSFSASLPKDDGSEHQEDPREENVAANGGWLPWYAGPDGFRYERRYVGPSRREERRTIRPDGTIFYDNNLPDMGGGSYSVRQQPSNGAQ